MPDAVRIDGQRWFVASMAALDEREDLVQRLSLVRHPVKPVGPRIVAEVPLERDVLAAFGVARDALHAARSALQGTEAASRPPFEAMTAERQWPSSLFDESRFDWSASDHRRSTTRGETRIDAAIEDGVAVFRTLLLQTARELSPATTTDARGFPDGAQWLAAVRACDGTRL